MIRAVIIIAATFPVSVLAADPVGDARAGRALAYAECRGCHGMDGKGTKAGVPNLGGRDSAYIMKALEEYRTGKRTHAPIAWIAKAAKPQELRDIAAYYASQPPVNPVDRPR